MWHDLWKERVKDFCELEKRFYPMGIAQKDGYRIADAYYAESNTVIEFQKSFDDSAIGKSDFYKNEKIKLIWLFYLPTLEVYLEDSKFNIREDNFYHFFRIEYINHDFFTNNIVFLQDKTDKIYLVNKLERVESNSELETTIRCFECKNVYENPDEFINWLKYKWPQCNSFKKKELEFRLKSLDEILNEFIDKVDYYFYIQNCFKNDKNCDSLVYQFRKGFNGFVKDGLNYISCRCYKHDNRYYTYTSGNDTKHNPYEKKWLLLATNFKKYNDEIVIKNEKNKSDNV